MKRIISVFLIFGFLLTFFACGEGDPAQTDGTQSTDGGQTDGTNTGGELSIVANGSQDYSIVWRSGAQGIEKDAALHLSSAVTEATGATLTMAIDLIMPGESDTAPEKSILVGRLSYSDVKSMWEILGENDYSVSEKDGNVYILGGSATAVYYAMMHFKNNFVSSENGTVSIPRNYSYVFEGADSRDDYINDPEKLLMSWANELETPEGMLDLAEKRASLADPDGRMMSFAHRGDSKNFPEDSIESVISACMMGADVIEVDVRVTKDGVAVLLHDETLTRTTNINEVKGTVVNGIRLPTSVKVSDWTLEQLRCLKLKAGNGGSGARVTDYIIPTFVEVVQVCKGRCMVLTDKITSANEMRSIVFPVAEKHDAYDSIMFCGEMSITDAFILRKELKSAGVAEDKLPMYLGRLSCRSSSAWQSSINTIEQGGMSSLFRFSGLSGVSEDGMEHLERMKDWLLSVKGKIRWQFDSQLGGNAMNETVELWDKAYELGVNSMMVDDPLPFCKYIAEKHFSK